MKVIIDTIERLTQAVNNSDLNAALEIYHDNAVVAIEPGIILKGKKDIAELFKNSFSLNYKIKQIKAHVIVTENIALFTSKWVYEEVNVEEQKSWNNVARIVLQKEEKNEWKIIIDNSFGIGALGL